MTDHEAGGREWLDQVKEEIIDPEREIVDPHHHLWRRIRWFKYMLEDLWTDTCSGHNVRKTVFVQCRSGYRTEGPEHLKPVGETEFVAEIAEESQKGPERILSSHHRMLRTQSLHVRKQLPGGQALNFLSRALERI